MATYTTFGDGSNSYVGPQIRGTNPGAPGTTFIQAFFDATLRNILAADKIEILRLPAGSIVEAVYSQVLVPEGTAATAGLGDTATPTGFMAALSVNAAAGTLTNGTGAYLYTTVNNTGPKLYTAETSIYFGGPSATLANSKVRFTFKVTNV